MNPASLTRLYPPGAEPVVPAVGCYLAHRLDKLGTSARPYVYSNYVMSLDGRIALQYPHTHHARIPSAITSSVDWRLYQELAAQADVLLTSGRYLRELACGLAQSPPPVGDGFPDLLAWRNEHGLTPQPAMVVLTRSLDLPLEMLTQEWGRRIFVATGEQAVQERLTVLAKSGANIIRSGSGKEVDGCRLIDELGNLGYRSIYSIAGPGLLDTLLRAGRVDRLYLTQVHTLLGGQCYDTLLESAVLIPPASFELCELYLDHGNTERPEQLFGVYRQRE